MASVSNSLAAVAAGQSKASEITDKTSNGLGKDAFLQLLVAQIRNQNPLNPADGVEFLTQLAQYSELEQMMGIRSGVEALQGALAPDRTAGGEAAESSTKGDV